MMWRRVPRAILVGGACVALMGGVGLAYKWPGVGAPWWLLFVGPALLRSARRHDGWALVLVVACMLGLGWWRGGMRMQELAPYHALQKQQVTVLGTATEDGVYDARQQMSFTLGHVQFRQPVQRGSPGSITVAGFGVAAVYRGDVVQVRGRLFPTRGNAQASIRFAQLQVVERGISPIDNFRRRFAAGVESAVPEPQASFGLGLLIGQRSTLPADTAQVLLMVGLTHLVAVSGYNLTILAQAARRLCGRRSKFQTAAVCVALVVLFLLLAGSSPSIVRAAFITLLGLWAWYYGRVVPPLVLLLVAGALSLVASPEYLWGNASWYLSFLAFFGVVVVAPQLARLCFWRRAPPLLAQIALETLCAELCTLPYVLYTFGQMSFVGIIANVAVAAVVPLAMLLCAVAGLAGMLLPQVAGWVAWPAHAVLWYMLAMARQLAAIPHAFVQGIRMPLPVCVGIYMVLSLAIWLLWRRTKYLQTQAERVKSN